MTLVGVVVLMLHDPADVMLITARAYTDYKYRKVWVNIFIYVCTYITWISLRNVFYPWCVIRACFNFYFTPRDEVLNDVVSAPILYQTLMLTCLAVM